MSVDRLRFPMMVVDAVTSVWGRERVGIRVSPTGAFNDMRDDDPVETYGALAARLEAAGIAYIEVVEDALGSAGGRPEPVIDAIRAAYTGAYVANGNYSADEARRRIVADLEQAGDEINEKLDGIEKALYQTKLEARQDPLNFPIRLNDKLAGVMGTAAVGDHPPTASAVAVRDELVARIDVDARTIRNVDTRDGLPSNQQCFGRARSADGTLYFGGFDGLIRFRPDEIVDRDFQPAVVLTGLLVGAETDAGPLAAAADDLVGQILDVVDHSALNALKAAA